MEFVRFCKLLLHGIYYYVLFWFCMVPYSLHTLQTNMKSINPNIDRNSLNGN